MWPSIRRRESWESPSRARSGSTTGARTPHPTLAPSRFVRPPGALPGRHAGWSAPRQEKEQRDHEREEDDHKHPDARHAAILALFAQPYSCFCRGLYSRAASRLADDCRKPPSLLALRAPAGATRRQSPQVAATTERRERGRITWATTLPTSSTPTARTSRRCTTDRWTAHLHLSCSVGTSNALTVPGEVQSYGQRNAPSGGFLVRLPS